MMVTLLAVLVLGGGAAYAQSQLAKNSVGTRQLKKGAVTSAKVKDGSLRRSDFRPGLLPAPAVPAPAGLQGARGAQGPAGPRGAQGPAGTSDVFQASGSVNFDKFSSSPFGSNVVALAVPPGSYFATATVDVQTVNGVASVVSCRLINGNGGPGSQATTRDQVARADGEPDNMTLAGGFTVTAGQDLNLQCSKAVPGSSARILVANIVAVGVGEVTGFAG
jgi:hypothetical protein